MPLISVSDADIIRTAGFDALVRPASADLVEGEACGVRVVCVHASFTARRPKACRISVLRGMGTRIGLRRAMAGVIVAAAFCAPPSTNLLSNP